MNEVHTHFLWLDWVVLFGYLLITTVIGHAMRGKQATMKDFFLGGRSLPWQAVSGSIVATEISAITFIAVPAAVFAAGGNFTYLQWAIGSILARGIVGFYFVPVFFEREIYSPYDYMAQRLGKGIKGFTTALFMVGSVLGQSVRVLVPAMVLRTVTPLSITESIMVVGAFAIVWTLMGGMTTVIWTDVIQFFMFVSSGVLALVWIILSLDGGWPQFTDVAGAAGKFELFRWLPPAESDVAFLQWVKDVEFTMWTALLAIPFQNLAAFGTDQLNAQRMFCCRSAKDARKAIIFSSVGQLVTVLMLMVGAALFVFYTTVRVPTPAEAELFKNNASYVFPVWVTTVLPPGITGLVLGGAFAAAISSLDSALAALSQTSMSLIYGSSSKGAPDTKAMLWRSRIAVVVWAGLLCLMTIAMYYIQEEARIELISLALGIVAYTYGPLLAVFLLALFGIRTRLWSLWLGLALSVLLTAWVRPDIYAIFKSVGVITDDQVKAMKPALSYAWLYPITCGITFLCGILARTGERSVKSSVEPAPWTNDE